MNEPLTLGRGAQRIRLRATIASIEREAARLIQQVTDEDGKRPRNDLLESCADLLEQLDLQSEPLVIACPLCGYDGRRDATICGYCWTKRSPS